MAIGPQRPVIDEEQEARIIEYLGSRCNYPFPTEDQSRKGLSVEFARYHDSELGTSRVSHIRLSGPNINLRTRTGDSPDVQSTTVYHKSQLGESQIIGLDEVARKALNSAGLTGVAVGTLQPRDNGYDISLSIPA